MEKDTHTEDEMRRMIVDAHLPRQMTDVKYERYR